MRVDRPGRQTADDVGRPGQPLRIAAVRERPQHQYGRPQRRPHRIEAGRAHASLGAVPARTTKAQTQSQPKKSANLST